MTALALIAFLAGLVVGASFYRKGGLMASRISEFFGGTRRRKITTALVTLALMGASVALAAWLINASGPGTAGIGSLQAPTVVGGTPDARTLLPGSDGPAFVRVTNPNDSALLITGVTDAAGGLGPASCPYVNVTVNPQAGLAVTVPASATTNIKIAGAYHLASDAPTACQGADVEKNVALAFATP